MEGPVPKEIYSAAFIDYVSAHFAQMAPLHDWLVAMVERTLAAGKA